MHRSAARPRAPSLTTAVVTFVALGAALAALATWYLVATRITELRRDALAAAVTVRATGVQLDFARALHQEWRAARIIADDIAERDASAVRSSLDLVVGDTTRVSWAGIAELDGTVRLSSGGLLEGQDVSQRPWFQRGLEGDFAGDIHDAVLLAKLLPGENGEPRRFLDLATAIRNDQGSPTAVLGLHLAESWALKHLRESAQALEIDAFILNREGEVVLATDESAGSLVNLASYRAAMTGASATSVETWPDGETYLTSVIPEVGYGDLPSFGWSMIARIDEDAIALGGALTSLWKVPAAFALLLAAMTALFVQVFARPFGKLARSAADIMNGAEVYPYESNSTSEGQTLSAAIARLQAKSGHPRSSPGE